ncbi:MAG TPA: Hsp20/alpha crystallin family protein [Ignavibacteriaceae bacterium]|nr:Hsp20/alpha crystallin family protein [Ignavibacteriaceae bacterium]
MNLKNNHTTNNKGDSKMTLVRFNPNRDLIDFEREFNKMFNSFENRFGISKSKDVDTEYENAVWAPLTDIYEDNDKFSLKVDLPGIKKEDVKISFTNGKLNISGERVQESESKDAKCHRIEKSYGKYFRSFNLPELIQSEKINAEFADGQLTITIPKAEEAKPKEIEIKVK